MNDLNDELGREGSRNFVEIVFQNLQRSQRSSSIEIDWEKQNYEFFPNMLLLKCKTKSVISKKKFIFLP